MAAEWYYTSNKQQLGPVSWLDLRELAETGILKPHDLVWTEGMDEWVKAVQQDGLFAEGSGRKVTAKPPPARRSKPRVEDDEVEDDEYDEDDDRVKRKKKRKREVERTKMKTGLKVGLILGGVLVGLLFLGCAGVVMVLLATRGGAKQAGGPNLVAPNPGAGRVHNYTVHNLPPKFDNRRQFTFQQGRRVVITVTNTLANPATDVDLLVTPTNNLNQVIAADIETPDKNRNCRAEFVVPLTQSYTISVQNLGPGFANSCHVRIEER